jgi:hypothetical protein
MRFKSLDDKSRPVSFESKARARRTNHREVESQAADYGDPCCGVCDLDWMDDETMDDWDGVPDRPLPQPAYRQVYAALRAAE